MNWTKYSKLKISNHISYRAFASMGPTESDWGFFSLQAISSASHMKNALDFCIIYDTLIFVLAHLNCIN